MSDPLEPQDDAATPLTEEERSDLILGWITLRAELNEAEQANILQAWQWASARRRNVLDERFLRNLHQKMFGQVWRWAGQFRRTARNIGVDAYRIPAELRQLLGDCRFWIEHQSYEADEIAVRFHHRLVQIHAFPNGNGRHARMATDLLLVSIGRPGFSWGRANLIDAGQTRRQYIKALRAADRHDYGPLMEFVRA